MPTPNHPMLPLCSAFAADPARYLFANWLETMLMDQPQETLQDDARRLLLDAQKKFPASAVLSETVRRLAP